LVSQAVPVKPAAQLQLKLFTPASEQVAPFLQGFDKQSLISVQVTPFPENPELQMHSLNFYILMFLVFFLNFITFYI
jgi:hypothetical protein